MPEKLKILVVDDQPGVRYLLNIVFNDSGYITYTAQNGLEAVNMASAIRPDIIFMDVRMPMMSGLEALAKIKSILPDIEVIIMTAYGSDETIDEAKKLGAMGCIAKPFDIEQIKSFLQDFERKKHRGGFFNTASAI